MKTLKYSRQRESIKACLMSRKDHPTADALYTSIREQFPNISLGTVYRNLNLLVELGEIRKLSCGDGTDHFDYDTSHITTTSAASADGSWIFRWKQPGAGDSRQRICAGNNRRPYRVFLWDMR